MKGAKGRPVCVVSTNRKTGIAAVCMPLNVWVHLGQHGVISRDVVEQVGVSPGIWYKHHSADTFSFPTLATGAGGGGGGGGG